MTTFVFIIESGNSESFEQEFKDRKLHNLINPTYNESLNIDDIDIMINEVSNKFKSDVVTVFVDQQYQIKYYYTDKGKEYNSFLDKLRERKKSIVFNNCNWHEYLNHFRGIDEELAKNNYIFATSKNFQNVYYMSNFLDLHMTYNSYYIYDIKNVTEIVNAKCYYNIFSIIPRKDSFDSLGNKMYEDIDAIEDIVETGIEQTTQLIKAGVLNNEAFIQKWVDTWVLNPESIFSKGIILEHGLVPTPPESLKEAKILKGFTIREQFNESSRYRYQILDAMCRCLCKYGLEFGKINTINNNPHTVNFKALLKK